MLYLVGWDTVENMETGADGWLDVVQSERTAAAPLWDPLGKVKWLTSAEWATVEYERIALDDSRAHLRLEAAS